MQKTQYTRTIIVKLTQLRKYQLTKLMDHRRERRKRKNKEEWHLLARQKQIVKLRAIKETLKVDKDG